MSGRSDTIFALSTPPGRGAIAVVRLSGARTADTLRGLLGGTLPAARRFARRRILGADGELLDEGVAIWLPAGPAGASYTGEDMAELQVHGGPAVVRALLDALAGLPGLRPAEPGEFTRRAFDSGRLDLVEAEAVADLVAAETERQRRQALAVGGGALSARLAGWEAALLGVSARVEAAIDFAEEDLPADLLDRCRREIVGVATTLRQAVEEVGFGERLREGFEVALVGAPNVGKSSLLNALARREAAIVHETAGTTRDVVEVRFDLEGFAVTLLDTAGLRDGAVDPVEREGIRRARARAQAADLVLALFDSEIWPDCDAATLDLVGGRTVLVLSKGDLAAPGAGVVSGRPALRVSARTGEGLAELQSELARRIADLGAAGVGGALFNRERHRVALRDCADALERAAAAGEVALVAEDLRMARDALGRLSGRIDVEQLLDRLFREFCIGK
ncbi:tRNA modification GTPase trmE [Tistlia consotensis]|uniref:tRNA modification GTPase MnmE n=1 Tax=Tistlia consotensis USBA 355 TaxID=560819 RepID=A0A1Y6BFZ2_9PROT|nr:tRNA uridine-5-carboxymethylaminomethyl(34) synthesis GTPase MnmE [Tistlia consotensis]SMF09069.1 tRNA modification GTPase trmE [Tistlia consotensis USBA 355]SNR34870.1 tRNA modification GTPase trmE [Tistlia consotensis]